MSTHSTSLVRSCLFVLLVGSAAAARAQSLLHSLEGDSPGGLHGYSVAGVGDLDGDGHAELIVGAFKDDSGGFEAGEATVYSGHDGTILFQWRGASAGDWLGYSVGGAGDVDADGVPDLVVGAPHANTAYVRSGATGDVLHAFQGADRFGWAVSGAGDVNGDGHADVVVGTWSDGSGGFEAGSVTVLSGADGSMLHSFQGASGDRLGDAVAGAGDVDGDGFADVIAGAPNFDDDVTDFGAANVYSGASGAILHVFHGDQDGDYLGSAVSGAGDWNGDGYHDLIVGSPGRDGWTGRAQVYSGLDGSVLFTTDGPYSGSSVGSSVANAGDVDMDGNDDVIVGAPSEGVLDRGAAKVFAGGSGDTIFVFLGRSNASDHDISAFGHDVAGAGDVDGDGRPDVIVGAYGQDLNGSAKVLTLAPNDPFDDYCTAGVNSTGLRADLLATGTGSVFVNDLVLQAAHLPANQTAIFFYGAERTQVPFGNGYRCVDGALFRLRFPSTSDQQGSVTRSVDLTNPETSHGSGRIEGGDTWRFQCWYRDPAGGGAGFNLTDALAIAFLP